MGWEPLSRRATITLGYSLPHKPIDNGANDCQFLLLQGIGTYNWVGCPDPIEVRFGSRAEELKVSTTSPLYPEKQTLARTAGMSH
jgi:hypothetical protein